ncbi:MAG: helix-turn-helix transcriptional regulator [Thermoproteus sp.]
MIVLNLTIPPLLFIMLAPAAFSNVSMPAPNASAVAAFSTNGTPLPALAYSGRVYVLQDWAPAYVEYVPAYANSSGVYSVSLSLDQGAVVVVPPGIMPQDISGAYKVLAVNKTGTYIEIGPGPITISYYAIRLSLAPAAPATSTSAAPYTSASIAPTAVSQSTTQTTQLFSLNAIYYIIAIVLVIIIVVIIVFTRKRNTII